MGWFLVMGEEGVAGPGDRLLPFFVVEGEFVSVVCCLMGRRSSNVDVSRSFMQRVF